MLGWSKRQGFFVDVKSLLGLRNLFCFIPHLIAMAATSLMRSVASLAGFHSLIESKCFSKGGYQNGSVRVSSGSSQVE